MRLSGGTHYFYIYYANNTDQNTNLCILMYFDVFYRVPDWYSETYQSSPPVQSGPLDWTGLVDWLLYQDGHTYILVLATYVGSTCLCKTCPTYVVQTYYVSNHYGVRSRKAYKIRRAKMRGARSKERGARPRPLLQLINFYSQDSIFHKQRHDWHLPTINE